MNIKTTVVYRYMEESYQKGFPVVVHQGSSRSSKTYNILIWLIVKCFTEWDNEIVDIGRKSFPSLRSSVMYDFFEIVNKMGVYDFSAHDKTNHTYRIRNNIVRFFSVDQETKVRGSKRSFLFLNEANEFKHDDFKQLNQRTTKMTILDYNPSDSTHWIYDDVLERDDVAFFKTTFRDNPFLAKRVRDEIWGYKDKDPNYWRIYGLGERGVSEATIFSHWGTCKEYDAEGQEFYGMDFGFNDPTTLVRVKYHEKGIVVDELLYKSHLTSDDIIRELNKLKSDKKLSDTSTIYADSARPEIIIDIKRAGYNIHAVQKEKGSILRGINFIKRHKIDLTVDSVNLIKEMKNYKWKVDKDGKVLDEPVDLLDHTIDATRYALDRVSSRKVFSDPSMGRANLWN